MLSTAHSGTAAIGGGGSAQPKINASLFPAHYHVKLSDEEFHRLTLWLDCNSEFFGAYENPAGQARGKIIWPGLE